MPLSTALRHQSSILLCKTVSLKTMAKVCPFPPARPAPGIVYSLVDTMLIMVQRSLICLLVMTGFNPKEVCISWSTRVSFWQFWMSVLHRLTRSAYYVVKSVRKSVAYWLNGAAEPRMAVIQEALFFEPRPEATYCDASTNTIETNTSMSLRCLPVSRRRSSPPLTPFRRTLINVLNREFASDLFEPFEESLFYNRDPTLEDLDVALRDEGDVTLELALLDCLNEDGLESEIIEAAYQSDSAESDTCTSSTSSFPEYSDIV